MASPLERGSCEQGKLPEDEAGGDMVQPRCDNEAPKPAAGVGCVSSSGGSTVAIEAGPAPLEATSLSYVSLITSDSFLPGVQVLVHSLRSTGTRHPIHIMATPQVSRGARRRVRSFGATVLSVDPIPNPNTSVHVDGWVNAGYTKLQLWGLTQFKKVVYIDADCLVQENVDELFETPAAFAAAPDVFPPDKFNAGVMVVTPDQSVLTAMLAAASTLPSHDGGDTGFLNSFFPGWFSSPAVARLPFGYNAQRTLHWMTAKRTPGYWEAVQPLKIIHYSSSPKPWESGARSGAGAGAGGSGKEGAGTSSSHSQRGDLELLWLRAFTASTSRSSSAASQALDMLIHMAKQGGQGDTGTQ